MNDEHVKLAETYDRVAARLVGRERELTLTLAAVAAGRTSSWRGRPAPAPRPADELWHALHGARPDRAPFEVYRVGDCLAPRRAHATVLEGERAGAPYDWIEH